MRLKYIISMILLAGCSGGSTVQPTFSFNVQDVFYIKPPVDRVILVGMIEKGSVKVGDSLLAHCRGGDVSVTLDAIETIDRGQIQSANAGQQVGLIIKGIAKDQPLKGDRVESKQP
jgi:translation elongation factor EF-Tu-like GTPase